MTETVVEVVQGRLRGRRTQLGVEFLGIPYARPERFAVAAPGEAWRGVRDAGTPGPASPQPAPAAAVFTHGEPPSANEAQCLNLNVFSASPGSSRPVLVWLHGGGLTVGHASASLYHGARLAADAGVVVVTVNYRLGSLGWLYHPELAKSPGAPAGNWGLLDQIEALRWVRENIAAFGGDPGRVTLAGQSAGAMCAMNLLGVPAARGLFTRAVIQSPAPDRAVQSGQVAATWAAELSALAGGGDSFDPQLLRSLATEQIVAMHERLLQRPDLRPTAARAAIDPGSLPESGTQVPIASIDVDVLIGSTADEGTFFVDPPWNRTGSGAPPQLPVGAVAEMTMATFTAPIARWATARAQGGGRVFLYRVDHRGAGPALGATHTVEVPLLFGTWRDGDAGQRLGGQGTKTKEVASCVVGAWAQFIRGEDPGWAQIPPDTGSHQLGVFGGAKPFATELA